eukprot:5123019-Prymnesium_polylepis.2
MRAHALMRVRSFIWGLAVVRAITFIAQHTLALHAHPHAHAPPQPAFSDRFPAPEPHPCPQRLHLTLALNTCAPRASRPAAARLLRPLPRAGARPLAAVRRRDPAQPAAAHRHRSGRRSGAEARAHL